MSFNAGGTNVGGVQAIEAGNLKVITKETLASVSTVITEITPPADKRYILKAIQAGSIGSMTITNITIRVTDTAASLNIPIVAGTTSVTYSPPQQITLTSNNKIRSEIVVSAHTSGNVVLRILVQEVDI